MRREEIKFEVDGLSCAGWFYQAHEPGQRPCVVMAHGLGAVKEMRLDAYAGCFAAAGYHVLVFDYRHFGASQGEPRQLLDIARQHRDWTAAIAYARSLPPVHAEKIVLWGSSLSGGHVIAVAAQDQRVAAVMAQVPHLDGFAALRATGLTRLMALTLHGLYDLARQVVGLSPHYVLSSAAAGEIAFMTAPGESAGYLKLVPEGMAFDRRVAARFALQIGRYSPGRALLRLKMPSLIQVGLDDLTTPAAPALALCRRTPGAVLKTYRCGHFQPYVAPLFRTIMQDQLLFLQRQFGASGARAPADPLQVAIQGRS